MKRIFSSPAVWVGMLGMLLWAGPGVAQERVHLVKRHDTLSSIARRYNVSTRVLAQWNHLENINVLPAGTRLIVPADDVMVRKYVVRKGDNLATIAYENGQTVARLQKLNHLDRPDLIVPGQTLLVPADGSRRWLTAALQKEIDDAAITRGRWKHIVVHHSASDLDNPEIMDKYHREVRHMENGLAYHFVVGGRGPRMADGEIYVGERWRSQLAGGHLASELLNEESIGICLVGNFNDEPPTARQMEALSELVEHLMDRCGLQPGDVETHRHINPKPTQCPGRLFSLDDLKQRLGRLTASR